MDKTKTVLISAARYEYARIQAEYFGLNYNGWRFIPLHDKEERRQRLSVHSLPRENLVGRFTQEERERITRACRRTA